MRRNSVGTSTTFSTCSWMKQCRLSQHSRAGRRAGGALYVARGCGDPPLLSPGTSGIDQLGPWRVIPQGIHHLVRERQTLHVTGNCRSVAGNVEEIAICRCVERLYLHFHYFVDEHPKPHAHGWCSEVVPTSSQDQRPVRLPQGSALSHVCFVQILLGRH